MRAMRPAKIALALACLLALQGCAAIALSVAGLVGGTGLDHTLDAIVYRTYAAPAAGTRLATVQTLQRMGMKVVKSEKQEKEWAIQAAAENRSISINLEPLSDRSTRVRVIVSQTDFTLIKDKSTGEGILDQIAIELESFTGEKHRFATVQMLLADLGYDPGEIDGRMGRNTRNAIVRFQRSSGIRPDGEPSRELIAKLRERKAAADAAALRAKQPEVAKQNESQGDATTQ